MKSKRQDSELKPTVWIGKKGCTEVVCEEIRRQIETRKIIKVRILRTAEMDPEEIARATSTTLRSVRGRTVILERKEDKRASQARNI